MGTGLEQKRKDTTIMKHTDFYRFEMKEAIDLCQNEETLSILYEFVKRFVHEEYKRPRNEAEILRRAEFYSIEPEYVKR